MSPAISFTVNGALCQVPESIRADTPLINFLRNGLGLKGTKYMCKEGACGSCIVTLTKKHPVTHETIIIAINSCLTPILSCNGCCITTIEGLGNKAIGYSEVQASLAKCSGTQCGFCSPGMVMNMHSLLKSNRDVTTSTIENSFGGNFCRCTGYRPILDAFKALARDGDPALKERIMDIEDFWKINKTGNDISKCQMNCHLCTKGCNVHNNSSLPDWEVPESFEALTNILKGRQSEQYVLVAGNTSQGVYRRQSSPSLMINVNGIRQLKEYSISDQNLVLGANMSLTEIMNLFYSLSSSKNFGFLRILADHISLVANVPVRNTGTLAGNLMIKYAHPEFPSDLFVILETVNAKIVIVSAEDNIENEHLSPSNFLFKDMKMSVITKVIIPCLGDDYKLRTFKIMPRAQNVYAYVNAGFLFRVDDKNNIIEKPNIVFGGLSPKFVHAEKTEEYLKNASCNVSTMRRALTLLWDEIKPEDGFHSSCEYRKKLAINLFYKFALGLLGENVQPFYRSGSANLIRQISSGKQEYQTLKDKWPLTKPLNKVESIIQCSGEAEYVNDITEAMGQLYGALVLAERACAYITHINPQPALDIDGVVAFYSAKDIPGRNVFLLKNHDGFIPEDEELFCSGKVKYGGQPVGVIVAETESLAEEAAKKVIITYRVEEAPVLTAKELLKNNEKSRITHFSTTSPTILTEHEGRHFLKGDVELGPQFHFTMEPQSCVCVPTEDGLNLYLASQWISVAQAAVAAALNIPANSINMEVKRLGGGFGCKITRSSLVGTACSLAAHKLNRPVRMVLDFSTNMKAIGKRNAAHSKYEVRFDDTGLIDSLKVWLYDDMGWNENDPGVGLALPGLKNCYEWSKWEINLYTLTTDTPSSSWMRAPGTIEGMVTIEEIMEHIAFVLKKDPLEVRMNNFNNSFPLLQDMISKTTKDSSYYQRKAEIQQFNEANRWRKRGISLLPMAFFLEYFITLNSTISIYAYDGTVSITHGGIEMGQGINTKVVQACAATLGIDTCKIKIKASSTLTSPNAAFSGASITSDCAVFSTIKCAEIINDRLKEVKEKLKGAPWEKVIEEAHSQEINLNATYMNRLRDGELQNYYIYGTAVTEVELDVLTGKYQILKAEILEDAGESLNPEIDVGQVEGGFVMGLGYFLLEGVTLDPNTGVTTSNSTASYYIPGANDIPVDFKVSLLKNAPNPTGVARSKATGEPPVCLALSASFSLRDAVKSARRDAGCQDWLPLIQPFSVEAACLSSETTLDHLLF